MRERQRGRVREAKRTCIQTLIQADAHTDRETKQSGTGLGDATAQEEQKTVYSYMLIHKYTCAYRGKELRDPAFQLEAYGKKRGQRTDKQEEQQQDSQQRGNKTRDRTGVINEGESAVRPAFSAASCASYSSLALLAASFCRAASASSSSATAMCWRAVGRVF